MNRKPRRRLISGTLLAVGAVVAAAASTNGSRDPAPAAMPSIRTPAPAVTAAPTAPAPPRTVHRSYGKGASGVAVVRPETRGPLPVVLFLHGWGYQRRSAYRAWIRHLARQGNAVIVPRYQTSVRSDPARVRGAMLRGVRTALRHVDARPRSLVAVGHSAGGALAADYAAIARAHGLPRPQAVYVVYPGRAILGTPGIPAADPARIPSETRLLVLAGARDTIVGEALARDLVGAAVQVPRSRRRFVLIRRPSVAVHLAPLRSTSAVRRTFWSRLDRLIASAR